MVSLKFNSIVLVLGSVYCKHALHPDHYKCSGFNCLLNSLPVSDQVDLTTFKRKGEPPKTTKILKAE